MLPPRRWPYTTLPTRVPTRVVIDWRHVARMVRISNIVSRDVLQLGGFFHSGVEVAGLEWAYGATGTPECGIFCGSPHGCPGHTYHRTLELGTVDLTEFQVLTILLHLSHEWKGNAYKLVSKNCNHFSQAFVRRLGEASGVPMHLPSWLVTRDLPQAHPPPADALAADTSAGSLNPVTRLLAHQSESAAVQARKWLEEQKLELRTERKKTRYTWAASLEG